MTVQTVSILKDGHEHGISAIGFNKDGSVSTVSGETEFPQAFKYDCVNIFNINKGDDRQK